MPFAHRVLVWASSPELRRSWSSGVVRARSGLDGLQTDLQAQEWDAVVLSCTTTDELGEAAERVREHPPHGFVLLDAPLAADVYPDSAHLPYEVWSESTPAFVPTAFERALEALREREALVAVRANRAMFVALAETLVPGVPLGESVATSMGILARGLGCTAAAFWQPAGDGRTLRRLACTGPLPALDQAASGDARVPACGKDRLLELELTTPVGEVLRSGRPRYPTDDADALVIPAASSGRTVGAVVLVGAEEVARRPTSFELAISGAAQIAALVSLTEAEDRFEAVASSSTDAIVLADADGNVVSFNVGAEAMFGYAPTEVLGAPLTVLMPERFRDLHAAGVRRLADGVPPRLIGQVLELTGLRRGGDEFPIELTLSMWDSGTERRYAGIIRDTTERVRAAERIRELAFSDQVTGLPNASALLARLEALSSPVGLIALDLGRFGMVVEALGVDAGGHVLQHVARRLGQAVPPEAVVHRRTGDEFVVLLESHDEKTLMRTAFALAAAIRAPMVVDGAELVFDGHVGATLTASGAGPAESVDLVLGALGVAREAGPGSVRRYADVRAELRAKLDLEAELRRGIACDELVLHHQPIVDLTTGRVRGVESLVRWQHPTRGLLGPQHFIDLAEQTGLIDELGRWVIDEACRQAAAWHGDGLTLDVSFNISPRQLLTGDVPAHLRAAIARTGVDPAHLTAEITETTALRDLEAGQGTLRELRRLGVRVALDDFGSGESSLGRLAELPVQVLKIDRSLVEGLPDQPASRALVTAAIQLATGLELRPLAEGIEHPAQLAWLRAHGCHDGQGYLFSRPVEASRLPQIAEHLLVASSTHREWAMKERGDHRIREPTT